MIEQAQKTVFVYGTLRHGGSNEFRMKGAVFLEHASARGRLYRVDWYPGAIFDCDADTRIIGELYQVTEEHLQMLDEFEGNEYQRVNILVITEKGSFETSAWEYRRPVEHLAQIMTGDWLKAYNP